MIDSPLERRLFRAASAFAVAGGVILCGLTAITVVSVIGRAALERPIPGDFELVAIGTGIAAFLCLPYCQLKRGHVTVDFLMARMAPRLAAVLDVIAALLCATIALLFAWRMTLGLIDAVRDRDVTIILGVPLWWAFPFAIASFALLAACCLSTARRDLWNMP
jgi:TRAP-type C4-dicarboxylate transport system permease small subunit